MSEGININEGIGVSDSGGGASSRLLMWRDNPDTAQETPNPGVGVYNQIVGTFIPADGVVDTSGGGISAKMFVAGYWARSGVAVNRTFRITLGLYDTNLLQYVPIDSGNYFQFTLNNALKRARQGFPPNKFLIPKDGIVTSMVANISDGRRFRQFSFALDLV
jgi:hypothetical protein